MLAVTFGLVLQSTPVTFESPGIRLVNLIPALSKSVGVPMRVAKHMENDVVAIRTAGRPWSEVRVNLAKVLNGEWREANGEFFLGQSETQQQAERDARRAYMVRFLEKRIAALSKSYSPTVWSEVEFNRWYSGFVTKPDAELNAASRRMVTMEKNRSKPTGRLMARLMRSIKPADLIPDDLDWEGKVFATDPFPLHLRLQVDGRDAYQKFAIENQMFFDRRSDDSEVITPPLVGAVIRIYDQPRSQVLSVDFYDAKGIPVETFFDFDRMTSIANFESPRVRPELSKLRDLAMLEEGADRDTLRTKIRSELGKATIHDALALFGGADWLAIAQERSLPMIAFLADESAFVPLDTGVRPEKGPIRMDSAGWMLGSQTDMILARKHRFDRSTLEKVAPFAIANGEGSGWFGVQGILEKARMSYLVESGHTYWLSDWNWLDFEFQSGEEGAYLSSWLGAMTIDEQQRLIQSGRLALSNLSPKAQEYFRQWIYPDGIITGQLDDRVTGAGFPNLERDLVMTSKISQESGYVRFRKENGEWVASSGDIASNFASTLFTGGFNELPDSIMVAPASRTLLQLTIWKRDRFHQANLYADWKPMGKPAKLTASQLARLKKLFDEMDKEVDPPLAPKAVFGLPGL